MTPKEYIDKYYQEDLKRLGSGVLCGRTLSKFYKQEEREKWPYLDHFLTCQYELNLLDQIVYSHFEIDHKEWHKNTLPFIDCRCSSGHGGVGHPLSIIWAAERDLSRRGKRFAVSRELILEYDKYFLDYVKEICNKNKFIKLNPDTLINSIKNDPDCQPEVITKYLKGSII